MSRQANAVTMIERQIRQISESLYSDAEFAKGMIQANYAHGFIDERQLDEFEQRTNDALLKRRTALRSAKSGRQMQALNMLHGVAS